MASIICRKCKRTGDSKCPYCRSIFGDDDTATGMLDTTISYRLKIDGDAIVLKKFNIPDYDEESHKVLSMVVNSVVRAAQTDNVSVEDVCRVLCCVHEWEFAPHCYAGISCGHRAPVDPDFEIRPGYGGELSAAGFNPDEVCECGDRLKGHGDAFACKCCPCQLFMTKKEGVTV